MQAASAPQSRSFGIVAAFASIYVVWGTTYLAIALAIQTFPAYISGALRFLLAAALLYGWLRWRSARPLEGVNLSAAVLCGVLLSGIGNGFVMWAQQGIPSGIAALVISSMPVLVLVLDWAFFSKRAPSRQALVGIAIALAGVVSIVVHTRNLSGAAQPMHLVALLVAALGWSFGTLLQKQSARPATVLSFTCVQMFAGGVFQLGMSFIDGEWLRFEPANVSWISLLAVAYLIVFGSIVALNSYLWLLTRVSAQKVTTYALVSPVIALLLGAVVLHERITALSIGAAVFVLAGVALVLFQDAHPLRWWRERWAALQTLR